MTAQRILGELKLLGSENYKKILFTHGATEPCFGVKIGDLKKIQKRVKRDHQLALDLFDTRNYDAMYLAGMISDDARMTRKDLQRWLDTATHAPIATYVVATTAAGNPHGWDLALKWIDSKDDTKAGAGWTTLAGIVATRPNEQLDFAAVKSLLARAAKEIKTAGNKTRYQIVTFIISVGSYVKPLADLAIETAGKLGKVEIDMGDTNCKVPDPVEYIRKSQKRGSLTKKRKSMKC